MAGDAICRWAGHARGRKVSSGANLPVPVSHPAPNTEIRPMTRPAANPAIRPFRLTHSAVEAHRDHLPTPFVGCPVCVRRAALKPIDIRWSSPRLG